MAAGPGHGLLTDVDGFDDEPTLLIANPSGDVYGSDLQMLETARAMVERSWRVVILVPDEGPLVSRLRRCGAEVRLAPYPVLRRAFASPSGVLRLSGSAMSAAWRLRGWIRALDPCLVYVNTLTLPWWLLAARLARVPVVCHVHEAEVTDHRLVRLALTSPLLLATQVIANGHPAERAALEVVPALRGRLRVIENGIAPPPQPLPQTRTRGQTRLLVIGRLSPRKATNIALEVTAELRAQGRDVVLEICGDAFHGYEWYAHQLRERSTRTDLYGAVTFSGYVADVWQALARSHILLAPSHGESMGNAVIQAHLARRPVVATAVQGHTESVEDGDTGLLVPADDVSAMATAIGRLMDDPALVGRLTEAGHAAASRRFAPARYDAEMASELARWCVRSRPRHRAS